MLIRDSPVPLAAEPDAGRASHFAGDLGVLRSLQLGELGTAWIMLATHDLEQSNPLTKAAHAEQATPIESELLGVAVDAVPHGETFIDDVIGGGHGHEFEAACIASSQVSTIG